MQYILFTAKLEAWAKETTKYKEQWKTLISWCVKKRCINFTGLAVIKYAWFTEEDESDESGRLQSSIIPTEWCYSYKMVLVLEDSTIPTVWYHSYSVVLFLQGGIIPTMCISTCRSTSKPRFKVVSRK